MSYLWLDQYQLILSFWDAGLRRCRIRRSWWRTRIALLGFRRLEEIHLHVVRESQSKVSNVPTTCNFNWQYLISRTLSRYLHSSRFSSIAWSQMSNNQATFPYGLIAGGMVDGNIHVWDASKLAIGEPDSLLASVEQHQGAIAGLQFNPHKESSHLLASGGSDAEVFVTSLEPPDQPSVFVPAPPPNNAKHTADITKVAWNTQVVHILASAAQNGSCYIWDLRQKKAWYVVLILIQKYCLRLL